MSKVEIEIIVMLSILVVGAIIAGVIPNKIQELAVKYTPLENDLQSLLLGTEDGRYLLVLIMLQMLSFDSVILLTTIIILQNNRDKQYVELGIALIVGLSMAVVDTLLLIVIEVYFDMYINRL